MNKQTLTINWTNHSLAPLFLTGSFAWVAVIIKIRWIAEWQVYAIILVVNKGLINRYSADFCSYSILLVLGSWYKSSFFFFLLVMTVLYCLATRFLPVYEWLRLRLQLDNKTEFSHCSFGQNKASYHCLNFTVFSLLRVVLLVVLLISFVLDGTFSRG